MPSEVGYHQIRRAKSAPSVKKRRQTASAPSLLDSEIARHHATTAASLAMAQARDRLANASLQKTARSSNEETGTMPSIRAIRRQPSVISLARERSSTGHSHNTVSDKQQVYDRMIDTSPANMSSVREFKGFGYDEELSAPSSYRRLRKSRSMFSTKSMRSLRNSGISSNISEETGPPSLRKSTDSTIGPHRSLRHSLSFFNGASQSIRRMKSHGAISSRRQHLPKLADEPLVPQMPPLPVANEGEPVRKAFRTTVRALREFSPDAETLAASNGGRLHSKARSFSITIKKQLKRVFGIPGYAESQSSEGHSVDSPSHDDNLIFESPTIIDRTTQPSLHPTKSSESIATSASRVTSWTNSTAGNTVRTRHTLDRHSLSTIEEGSDFANQQPPGFSEIYGNDNARNRRGKMIDSQRVYSALMRHIDETATRGSERVVSSGTIKGSPVVMGCSPSVHTQRDHGSIHKIPSDMSMRTAQTSFMIAPQVYGSQSSLSLRSLTERPITPLKTKQAQRPSSVASSKVTLRETRSLFFPSGASPKLKTPSPYRAAMNSRRETEDESSRYTPSIIITGIDNDKSDTPSPSIYSRTPSGHAASREYFDYEPEEPIEPGVATIYDAQVPYKSPKRHESQATETGPRNSSEWRHWMNYQMDSISNFNTSNLGSEREHHREDSECDGEPIQRSPIENAAISSHPNGSRDESLGRLRQIYTSRQVSQIEDTVQGQNNFSRPLSRQSMGAFQTLARHSSINGKQRYLNQGTDSNLPNIPRGHQTDLLFNESPEGPVSPSRRQTIRAAREARLSRGNIRQNTLRQGDDQQDAKAVQFRSIREAPSVAKRNKENEMPQSTKEKMKTTGTSGIEDIHMTIGSKRMVDMFLDSRRGRQSSLASEGIGSVFI
ncbi:hypothetical protein UA08_07049 [Talaromyces atroroseus]|uniref:Uncharacterized protein n=1 Tax=Talaromyces atroroseus TaxID=1441469 RepID=A0A225APF7_TALAT|nr:hypothetical protein UA08_07049 [Talaromyces atroroseus]OKL57489.1 hypothetical protein UA08_07049 [Talaromyces atroroseus]